MLIVRLMPLVAQMREAAPAGRHSVAARGRALGPSVRLTMGVRMQKDQNQKSHTSPPTW